MQHTGCMSCIHGPESTAMHFFVASTLGTVFLLHSNHSQHSALSCHVPVHIQKVHSSSLAAHLMHRVAAASIGMSSGTSYRSAAGKTAAVRQKPIAAARGTTRLPCFRPVTCSPHAPHVQQQPDLLLACQLLEQCFTEGHAVCLWKSKTSLPCFRLITCRLWRQVSFRSQIGSLHLNTKHPDIAERGILGTCSPMLHELQLN